MNLDQTEVSASSSAVQNFNARSSGAFQVPDHWLHLDNETKLNSKLSDDFCFIKESNNKISRYIRCVLEIPLAQYKNSESQTDLNVWMSVCEQTWLMYWRGFRTGKFKQSSSVGYLSNALVGFDIRYDSPAKLYFRAAYERPLVRFENYPHLPIIEQKKGTGYEILDVQAKPVKLVH